MFKPVNSGWGEYLYNVNSKRSPMYNWLHLVPDPEDIQKLFSRFMKLFKILEIVLGFPRSFRIRKIS
jgi:hypothetical protein